MNDKTAVTIARLIENEIISKGWPVGEILGSEAELIRRFGVSRGVLRETVRLLEHKQVVTMKPGPGGGLVVSAPAAAAVAESVSNYFTLTAVSVAELVEARRLIAADSLVLASDRLSERGIARLRSAATGSPEDFHGALADLTRNAALAIVLESLRLALCAMSPTSTALQPQVRLVDALVRGDLLTAHERWHALLEEEALAASAAEADGHARGHGRKRPEQLAHQIARDLRERGYEPGDLVGSESELLGRYSVSRSVFRQAVRILEYSGVAHMRPGSNGGMVVGAGDPTRVVEGTVTFLDFMQIAPSQVAEARRVLELNALKLAMRHMDDAARELLRNELVLERSVERATVHRHGPDFHRLLAELSRNRPLFFFTRVLTQLQTLRIRKTRRTPTERDLIGASILDAHVRVVEAIESGDEGLARHRLRRHLEAMVPNMAERRIVVEESTDDRP